MSLIKIGFVLPKVQVLQLKIVYVIDSTYGAPTASTRTSLVALKLEELWQRPSHCFGCPFGFCCRHWRRAFDRRRNIQFAPIQCSLHASDVGSRTKAVQCCELSKRRDLLDHCNFDPPDLREVELRFRSRTGAFKDDRVSRIAAILRASLSTRLARSAVDGMVAARPWR